MNEEENNPLMRAVMEGDLPLVKRLIRRGADIEVRGLFGHTPLMVAVRGAHMKITSHLIKKGANVNAVSVVSKETALTIASLIGRTNFVAYLISKGADTEMGVCTALMDAAVEGNFHTVKYLLENTNAVVNARSPSGYTPLFYACDNNHTEVAKILLEHGADIENECQTGQTPLMTACFRGNEATVRILLEWNANVDHVGQGSETALTVASVFGHAKIVKFLIEKGADVEHEAEGSLTPLMLACSMGHLDVVKTLVRYMADVNHMPPSREYTALSMACFEGQVDVVKYLLSSTDANPNLSLQNHRTLLMETVRGQENRDDSDTRAVEIATFLLDYPYSLFEMMFTSEGEDV